MLAMPERRYGQHPPVRTTAKLRPAAAMMGALFDGGSLGIKVSKVQAQINRVQIAATTLAHPHSATSPSAEVFAATLAAERCGSFSAASKSNGSNSVSSAASSGTETSVINGQTTIR